MNAVVLGVLGYVVLQFGIGAYVSRRIRTEDDYLVAGRSLGYGLATFTIFATWFGAETCIGAAGAIYERGLSGGTADPFGYGICLLAMGIFFAVPLWRRRLTTLPDLFRQRFGSSVERFAVLLMVPTSLLWAAAQIRAFGQILSALSGATVLLTISFAALVVVAYTVFGGLLADAWTDLVQGMVLMVGLLVLAVAVLGDIGTGVLAQIPAERLRPFGAGEASLLAIAEDWAIPICGSVLAAELVSRIIATRSPQVAQRSSLLAGGIYIAFGLIPVAIGLLGFVLVPDLADPEQILPLIAQQYLPTALYVLFVGALVSAILSTVDTTLLVAASMLSHNVLAPLRPDLSESGKVRLARSCVALFGVLAYGLALYADGVYALVEEASAFGSSGLFVVIVFGLFTGLGGATSATVSLLTGVTVWVAGAHLWGLPYPYLASLAAAALAYIGVAALFLAARVAEPRPVV